MDDCAGRVAMFVRRSFVSFAAALLCPLASASAQISIEMQINGTADPADDYLCWSPTPVRAHLAGDSANNLEVVIGFEEASAASTGALQFQADKGSPPAWNEFAPDDTLHLTLPADGSWVTFYVAGQAASTDQKDVAIVTRPRVGGPVLGSVLAMVRVRKDVRRLTQVERRKFLAAVRALHDAGHFEKYWRAHDAAFRHDIHGMFAPPYTPLFLAWHRAFLLNFERELQAIDPDVALPYWKFDEPSFFPGEASVFTSDFLGEHAASGIVVFDVNTTAAPNPWHNWRTGVSTRPLERMRHPDRRSVISGSVEGPVRLGALSTILSNDDNHRDAGGDIEAAYHNGAHARILGWIGQRFSPADPLFFLLHANVDRAFAHWQEGHDAWDRSGNDPHSYHATGSHPGPGSDYLAGSYALDEMWPWNPGQPGWPSGMYFQMPPGAGGPVPPPVPTPASQIDYLNLSGDGLQSGACYDDIGFTK